MTSRIKPLTASLPDAAARRALGLAARKQLARGSIAALALAKCSKDPLRLLFRSERGRVQALVVLKHQRMAVSPFGFFRGAVPIMAADLSVHPHTGLMTQLCGDAHVENLGAYASPIDGRLLFDINDFDETIHGPFEWDIKRLATSLVLAGREAGIKRHARQQAVLHFAAQYRSHLSAFAAMPILELARHQIHRLARQAPMPAILSQAERSTPQKSLKSLTEPEPKAVTPSNPSVAAKRELKALAPERQPRIFRTNPPVLRRATDKEAGSVLASFAAYLPTLQPERRALLAQYRAIDVAFKVVGTGSVGLRDYCIYLEGTHAGRSDPLFLQIKQEVRSAYASYLPRNAVPQAHQGHRVTDGQRAMQLSSDAFLGYTTMPDERGRPLDYLVRQLNDHKASLDLASLTPESLLGYADVCGELFARGHARAGDPVALSAYLGDSSRFDDALLRFAHAYADKTERDWEHFRRRMK